MPEYKRVQKWPGWRGSTADVAELAELAYDVGVSAAGGEKDLSFSVGVEMPGVEESFRSPSEVRAGLSTVDVAQVTLITIWASVWDSHLPRYQMHLMLTSSGINLSVQGENRTMVDGSLAQAREALDRGRRRGVDRMSTITPWLFGTGCGLALGGSLLGAGEEELQPVPTAMTLLALALMMAVATAWACRRWLIPRFELVQAGHPTRWERHRRRAITGALAVGGILLAAVAEALTGTLLG